MSDYLGSTRFIVSECEGGWIDHESGQARGKDRLSVAVLDRAYCCQVMWNSNRPLPPWMLRNEAHQRADALNAKYA